MTKTGQGALAILAASFMTGAIGTPAAQAQTFKVLHTFGGPGDGGIPYAGLVRTRRAIFTALLRSAVHRTTESCSSWTRPATRRFCTASQGERMGQTPQRACSVTRPGISTALL